MIINRNWIGRIFLQHSVTSNSNPDPTPNLYGLHSPLWSRNHFQTSIIHDLDLLTPKSIGHILDSWGVSVWSFMIIGWLQSQLSSGNHFQITMRHDLDLWTSKSIGRILDSWWVSVWSFMIIGWLQSQLSSGNHFQTRGQHIGATYKSILKVLLKQYRSPTDPNKFKSATIISVDHFQITMRHDLDRWPFDPKINRAHPWLMGSKCMKFHDHRLITESVIVRKPFSNNHAPWPWPLTFWPQNQ